MPNWDSNPSAVLTSVGVAMMPALLMRMFSVDVWERTDFAADLTLSRELRSMSTRTTWSGLRISRGRLRLS